MTPEIGSSSETSSTRRVLADLSSRWQRTLQSAGDRRRLRVAHAVQRHARSGREVAQSDIRSGEELIRAGWFVVDHFKQPD
jgi:hypothetical protein